MYAVTMLKKTSDFGHRLNFNLSSEALEIDMVCHKTLLTVCCYFVVVVLVFDTVREFKNVTIQKFKEAGVNCAICRINK